VLRHIKTKGGTIMSEFSEQFEKETGEAAYVILDRGKRRYLSGYVKWLEDKLTDVTQDAKEEVVESTEVNINITAPEDLEKFVTDNKEEFKKAISKSMETNVLVPTKTLKTRRKLNK
jgi:hypothetical protein